MKEIRVLREKINFILYLSLRFCRESRLGSPVVSHFVHPRSVSLKGNAQTERRRYQLRTVTRSSPSDDCGTTDAPRNRVPIGKSKSPFDAYWPTRDWSSIEFSSDAETRDLRSPVWHEDDVRRRL